MAVRKLALGSSRAVAGGDAGWQTRGRGYLNCLRNGPSFRQAKLAADVLDIGQSPGIGVGQAPLDRTTDRELVHQRVPNGVVGQLLQQPIGLLLGGKLGRGHWHDAGRRPRRVGSGVE